MDIDIYFQPIKSLQYAKNTLGYFTDFHTEDNFPFWEESDIAIIGVNEDRGTESNKGCAIGADAIRKELFGLYHHNKDIKICDLGNIFPGAKVEDTYHAVSDVIQNLIKKNVFIVILGGSQDITFANYKAYEKLEQTVNLVSIDSKFDLGNDEENLSSSNFLSKIILHKPNYLFNYGHLGYQTYYVSPDETKLMNDLYFDYTRLGEIQEDVQNAEPLIRNADILSVDVSSVRSSELSSNSGSGPNGFYGDEICQLMRYAGMSDKLSSVGFYEFNPNTGASKMSAKLIGQMIWCLIDGFTNRKKDYPIGTKEKYTRYRVHVEGTEHELVFYKSDKTDRWWMDVPYPPDKRVRFERHHLVPCTYAEYKCSSDNEIPDLWWRTYRKLN